MSDQWTLLASWAIGGLVGFVIFQVYQFQTTVKDKARHRDFLDSVHEPRDDYVTVPRHRWEAGQFAIKVLSHLDEGPLHPQINDIERARQVVTDFHEYMMATALSRSVNRTAEGMDD